MLSWCPSPCLSLCPPLTLIDTFKILFSVRLGLSQISMAVNWQSPRTGRLTNLVILPGVSTLRGRASPVSREKNTSYYYLLMEPKIRLLRKHIKMQVVGLCRLPEKPVSGRLLSGVVHSRSQVGVRGDKPPRTGVGKQDTYPGIALPLVAVGAKRTEFCIWNLSTFCLIFL